MKNTPKTTDNASTTDKITTMPNLKASKILSISRYLITSDINQNRKHSKTNETDNIE